MKTFSVKNFRSFGPEGATFDISPITILTGCNSSGKSSLVKAMALLSDMLKLVDGHPERLNTAYLDFAMSNNKYGLGRFSKIINKKAGLDGEVEMSYTYGSKLAGMDLQVKYVFAYDPNDEFDNGHLVGFSLFSDETLILKVGKDEYGIWRILDQNWSVLKDPFLKFAVATLAFRRIDDLDTSNAVGKDLAFPDYGGTEEELKVSIKRDIAGLKSILHDLECSEGELSAFDTVYRKFRNKESKRTFFQKFDKYGKAIDNFYDHGLLVYNPLIEYISAVDKNQVGDYLRDRYADYCSGHANYSTVLDCIIQDFECSDFETFLDFYHSLDSRIQLCDSLFTSSPFNRDAFEFSWQTYNFGIDFSDGGESIPVSCLFDSEEIGVIEKSKRLPPKSVQIKDEYATSNPSQKAIGILKVLWDLENWVNHFSDNTDLYTESGKGADYHVRIKMVDLFKEYLSNIIEESLTPEALMSFRYIGSSWPKASRLYTLDKSDEPLVRLLLRYRDAKQRFSFMLDKDRYEKNIEYRPNDFVKKWMKEFGVGDDVMLNTTDEGDGIRIMLLKNGEKVLLADEGYGITQLISTLLNIEVAIMDSSWGHIENASYLGWKHKSQGSRKCEGSLVSIEEPETHLHPALQSKLAEMFLEAYEKYNIRFLVETHSEYLIRMSQVLVKRMGFESNQESNEKSPFKTYYIPNVGLPYNMWYRKDGKFAERFGDGFYNEAASLTNLIL